VDSVCHEAGVDGGAPDEDASAVQEAHAAAVPQRKRSAGGGGTCRGNATGQPSKELPVMQSIFTCARMPLELETPQGGSRLDTTLAPKRKRQAGPSNTSRARA
jgi:hypothetical protein